MDGEQGHKTTENKQWSSFTNHELIFVNYLNFTKKRNGRIGTGVVNHEYIIHRSFKIYELALLNIYIDLKFGFSLDQEKYFMNIA